MRKLILSGMLMLCALTVSAQRTSSSTSSFFSSEKSDESIKLGVEVGLNLATLGGDIEDADTRASFNVGLSVDIPILESLHIKTGLYYTEKGYKYEYEDDYYEDEEEETMNAGYLEIPVLASYRYAFSDNLELQINVGPYFAYGITGKTKWEETYGDETYEEKYDTFDDGNLKKFDWGLSFGAGLTIADHYSVRLGYELGLANVCDDDDYDLKNRNFFISVGYTF